MLGYVQVYKPELKLREYEIYKGYYCGVCKYIGATYGQLPRMVLSYDAAFLAMLLEAVSDSEDKLSYEHCIAHHIEKRPIIRNKAVEYAGDVMLILAWHKLKDDASDEGKLSAKTGLAVYRRLYTKLSAKYPGLCAAVEDYLAQLSELEDAHCDSLDQVAEAFAKIMEIIFLEGLNFLHRISSNPVYSEAEKAIKTLGYHLGKWIYLMDAAEDIEENLKSGAYNPLIYRHQYAADESPSDFRARIAGNLQFNLYHYLAVISDTLKDLHLQKNSGIIENVIYFGLNRKTEEILKGETNESI